jgi:hypothetical protein
MHSHAHVASPSLDRHLIPFIRGQWRGGEKMHVYERPTLTHAGSFASKTGLLQKHGNDRLILSKN